MHAVKKQTACVCHPERSAIEICSTPWPMGAESRDPENTCGIDAASRRSHEAVSRKFHGTAWRMTHRRDPSTHPHPAAAGLGFAQDDNLYNNHNSPSYCWRESRVNTTKPQSTTQPSLQSSGRKPLSSPDA